MTTDYEMPSEILLHQNEQQGEGKIDRHAVTHSLCCCMLLVRLHASSCSLHSRSPLVHSHASRAKAVWLDLGNVWCTVGCEAVCRCNNRARREEGRDLCANVCGCRRSGRRHHGRTDWERSVCHITRGGHYTVGVPSRISRPELVRHW